VLDGGGWMMSYPTCFCPGNDLVHTVLEAGWAPGPVWTDAEYLPFLGYDPSTTQPVVSLSHPTSFYVIKLLQQDAFSIHRCKKRHIISYYSKCT